MNEVSTIIGSVGGSLANIDTIEKIEALEAEWLKLPQIEIPVKEYFAAGMYAREITIPADTFLTGELYLDNHFDLMISGDITVSSNDGIKRLTGFNFMESFPGKKRAGYTHSETHWMTFNRVDTYDPSNEISVKKFADLENGYVQEPEILNAFTRAYSMAGGDVSYQVFREGYLLGKGKPAKIDADWLDYKRVLDEMGVGESLARAQSENLDDQIEIDLSAYQVYVGRSLIEGQGLHCNTMFRKGQTILPARINGKRTAAGRYTNHSVKPNAEMVPRGSDIDLVAIKDIGQEEITVNYRHRSLNIKQVG
ncbi:MAG: SET domain-containing protein-lysine N-methyltransferase [Nitrosomonadaceae bacterium]